MIRSITAYRDSKGKIHETKEAALLVDIELALGKLGTGPESMTAGFALRVVAARAKLIPLLQDFDGPSPAPAAPVTSDLLCVRA
jgi:hypothetical protein